MSYVTVAAMVLRYGEREIRELSDRSGAGAINSAVVERAIADAAAECNSWIAARWPVPVQAPSDRLRAVCADIARYRLWADGAPEHVRRAYDDAIAWLKAVAAGDAVPAAAPESAGAPAGPRARIDARPRLWTVSA